MATDQFRWEDRVFLPDDVQQARLEFCAAGLKLWRHLDDGEVQGEAPLIPALARFDSAAVAYMREMALPFSP